MALIPIEWNVDIDTNSENQSVKIIYTTKDLGTVFGTQYNLDLRVQNGFKINLFNPSYYEIVVQLERSGELSSSTVYGSIYFREFQSYKEISIEDVSSFF